MRIFRRDLRSGRHTFLSIQAQDFIEEATSHTTIPRPSFLSIQAQDFIEDLLTRNAPWNFVIFLSIQAQDFIEETIWRSVSMLL